MLSIIIPSRTDEFLNKTIQDILDKATGEIEVIPVLDGYEKQDEYHIDYKPIIDPRVKYISIPNNGQRQKRQAVNAGVSISRGEYIMWIDAHCVVAPGFDEELAKNCDDDWIVVPRRYKLNIKKWDREEWGSRPPIDYTYWIYQYLRKGRFEPYRWDRKALERKDIMIDDIFTAQGSFFFMTRKWFDKMGFMKTEGYTGWGQEGEEICLTTILNGGRAVVNKNTWYAHLSKKRMPRRMYETIDATPSFDYSFDYWTSHQKDFFIKLINKFMPPNYKEDWAEKLYEHLRTHKK